MTQTKLKCTTVTPSHQSTLLAMHR